jgi:hypothetical protein
MRDDLTLNNDEPEKVKGRGLQLGLDELRAVQGRARCLLGLPSEKVVLDAVDRRALERLLDVTRWDEVMPSDEDICADVWECTVREYQLRGDKWEGGAM